MTGLWPEGSGRKVLKFDGAFAPKVLRFDSPFGLRVVVSPPLAAMSIKSTLREYLPYAFVTLNMAVSYPLLVAFFPLGTSFSSLEGRLYGFPTGEARF